MRQVFYIDVDEEIIAVIGRLRRSASREDTLVVPKRALILQSIVNLRLLAREAQKLNKDIIVVTPDEQGRLLAEKAGLATAPALNETPVPEEMMPSQAARDASSMLPEAAVASSISQPTSKEVFGGNEKRRHEASLPRAEAIGSSDFFSSSSAFAASEIGDLSLRPSENTEGEKPLKVYSPVTSISQPQKLVVRDRSPKNLTALNSRMTPSDQPSVWQQPTFSSNTIPAPSSSSPKFQPGTFQKEPAPARTPQASGMNIPAPRLPAYFNHPPDHGSPAASAASLSTIKKPKSAEAPSPKVPGNKKLRGVFWFFALISVLSLVGLGAYFFLPKAEVNIKLKNFTQKTDADFLGLEEAKISSQDKTIPIRWVEKEGQVDMSFESTGKSSLSDRKARGTVVIRNEYSTDPQSLVASTRLLSQDGKLFRLVSGVTVPGMVSKNDQNEPGSVEAAVIADQSGAEYNIGPSTFTIPGFQGSPKYGKFNAQSVKIMTGGGVDGSDMKAVSEGDIAKAKRMAELSIKAEARRILEADLRSGEKLLDDAFESTVVTSAASVQSGVIADAFDYRVTFKVRAMMFSEDDLENALPEIFLKQAKSQETNLSLARLDLEYGQPTPDFSSRALKIKVHAVAKFQPDFDVDQFKEEALGEDEQGISDLFDRYSHHLETVNVTFWPEFLVRRVPTNPGRVTVSVEPFPEPQK